MFQSISRAIRPLSGASTRLLLRQQILPSSVIAAQNAGSVRCLTASSIRNDDKKDDAGNPFSVDDMFLSSSKKDLEHFDVPDPVVVHENTTPEHLNENEIILNSASESNIEDFNVPDPISKVKESLNEDEMILKSTANETEENEEYMNDDDISAEILNVALEFVSTHGWTQKSIDAAVEALELSMSTAGMFKRGPAELVLHFIETSNAKLFEILAKESKRFDGNTGVSTSDFIENAVKERLKMIIPYMDSWPQALALMASPSMAAEVLEQGANMVDEIWYHAGDMSSDMSWYSKRAAVAALHLSTELYMLQDKSASFEDTWDFLHRRVKDIETAATAKDSVDHALQDAMSLVGSGLTTIQNLLGVNNRIR